MAFDGVNYSDFDLARPNVYHPHAPLVGPAYARPLRTAYAYAQHHGRMVIDQHYPFTRRTFNLLDRAFQKTTFVRLAEGYRRVHDEVTHLVAEVHFLAPFPVIFTTAYHRICVTDGIATDTGSTVESAVASPPNLRLAWSPYESRDIYTVRCEVKLDSVTPGAGRLVYVEGYLDDQWCAPLHVGVWTEIREP